MALWDNFSWDDGTLWDYETVTLNSTLPIAAAVQGVVKDYVVINSTVEFTAVFIDASGPIIASLPVSANVLLNAFTPIVMSGAMSGSSAATVEFIGVVFDRPVRMPLRRPLNNENLPKQGDIA